jgi:hypothetical protein
LELSATTTTIDRISCARRRASEREGEPEYPNKLLIGEEMAELEAKRGGHFLDCGSVSVFWISGGELVADPHTG